MGLHSFEDLVEVVRIHLDKLPVAKSGQGFHGLAGKISQNPHYERQLFEFNRVSYFDVIGDLHSRRPNTIQFVLRALSCHKVLVVLLRRCLVKSLMELPKRRSDSARLSSLDLKIQREYIGASQASQVN
jgi:hypothetical protein